MKRIILAVGSVLSAILACALLSSCYQVDMINGSSNSKYSHLVGKEFRLKEEVWANGLCLHNPRHEVADYIRLSASSGGGFGVRQVVSRSRLGKGTAFQIAEVWFNRDPILETFALLFGSSNADYVIKVIGPTPAQLPSGVPIKVWPTGKIDNGTYGLDGNDYEVLP